MTQYQFDPSTLLDAFHDRPDLDLVREMVGFLYQALIDIEATEVIGAEPHEREGYPIADPPTMRAVVGF